MTKSRYIKHPIKPTELSRKVLKARLSLRETQPEFAKRFMVSHITVHNWETGKTRHIQRIHKEILANLLKKLQNEGRLIDDSVLTSIYRTEMENKEYVVA